MTQKMAKKISLKPLGNRVVAKRTEEEETTKGGIILPDSAKQKQETATVVAIGTGSKTKDGKEIPVPVSVGDTILMDKYAAQEVSIDDEEYIIVKADDIIAIVEN
ncbi:MAG: 10 kDa chaperonin [Chlamydiae bacterium]|nr:10 kDa chaperonin [Chlamydiota bacterium]